MNWLNTALYAAVFFSISDILYKHILKMTNEKILGYITIYYLVFGIIGLFFLNKHKPIINNFTKKEMFFTILISCLMALASFLAWRSYIDAPQPALPRGIMSIQLIIMLTVSCLIFNVKTTLNEIIGIAFIVLGIIFISTGKIKLKNY